MAPTSESSPTSKFVIHLHNFTSLTGTNRESSDRAVAGVTGGHQIRVKSWFEAATLYNEFYNQGNIVRVRIL